MPDKTGRKEPNMESMEKPAVGTERYIKPQMEIIEMENDIIVTSDDDCSGYCDDYEEGREDPIIPI